MSDVLPLGGRTFFNGGIPAGVINIIARIIILKYNRKYITPSKSIYGIRAR
jgi:hypothetical protein